MTLAEHKNLGSQKEKNKQVGLKSMLCVERTLLQRLSLWGALLVLTLAFSEVVERGNIPTRLKHGCGTTQTVALIGI